MVIETSVVCHAMTHANHDTDLQDLSSILEIMTVETVHSSSHLQLLSYSWLCSSIARLEVYGNAAPAGQSHGRVHEVVPEDQVLCEMGLVLRLLSQKPVLL